MLTGTNDLIQYKVNARDGDLGSLHDLSFDDTTWQVRHLVIDTCSWLSHRILMHPLAIRRCQREDRLIELTVTRSQVQHSPAVDAALPLSQRRAEQYYSHFGWPPYWPSLGRGFSGAPRPYCLSATLNRPGDVAGDCDPHLRREGRPAGLSGTGPSRTSRSTRRRNGRYRYLDRETLRG
jgi:hypothetical protein